MHSAHTKTVGACLGTILVAVLAMIGSAAAQSTATIVFRGQSSSVATSGDLFSVADAARALGLKVSRDTTTGILTVGTDSHKVVVGPGSALIPVDGRPVEISQATRVVRGVLYAPMDLFAKALFPLVGASGVYDSGTRVWTISERR